MGIGDEIMVTGEVKRSPIRKLAIFDPRKGGIHRWHEMWVNNPRIAAPGEPFDDRYYNSGGCRPYISGKGEKAWVWNAYKPEPGEIFLTEHEKSFARFGEGRIVINPNIKPNASPNKFWTGWQSLIDRSRGTGLKWLQVGNATDPRLQGVDYCVTQTFREACGVLSGARGALLHEGGLHHACAALGVRAVVLFMGYIGPKVTGYDTHVNVFHDDPKFPLGCGMRIWCAHCDRARQQVTTKLIKSELEKIL